MQQIRAIGYAAVWRWPTGPGMVLVMVLEMLLQSLGQGSRVRTWAGCWGRPLQQQELYNLWDSGVGDSINSGVGSLLVRGKVTGAAYKVAGAAYIFVAGDIQGGQVGLQLGCKKAGNASFYYAKF